MVFVAAPAGVNEPLGVDVGLLGGLALARFECGDCKSELDVE